MHLVMFDIDGTLTESAEKSENHTVTVREAARLFEAGGAHVLSEA